MAEITVLTDEAAVVDGTIADGAVMVDPSALPGAIGWELKPEGLCQGDVCVPVADPARLSGSAGGDGVDLVAVAELLGSMTLVDDSLGTVAVSKPSQNRDQVGNAMVAPELRLADLDGNEVSTAQFRGRKKLLVVFASW